MLREQGEVRIDTKEGFIPHANAAAVTPTTCAMRVSTGVSSRWNSPGTKLILSISGEIWTERQIKVNEEVRCTGERRTC